MPSATKKTLPAKKNAPKKSSGAGKSAVKRKSATKESAAGKADRPRKTRTRGKPAADVAQDFNPHLLSRFAMLVNRATFELRLAGDVAQSTGLNSSITQPLSSARRQLYNCLREFDRLKATLGRKG